MRLVAVPILAFVFGAAGEMQAQLQDSQVKELQELLVRVKKDFESNEALVLSDFEKQVQTAAGNPMEAYKWFKEIGGQEPQYDRLVARKLSEASKNSDKEEGKNKGKSGGRSAHQQAEVEDLSEATQGSFKGCLQRQCQLILYALRFSADPAVQPGVDNEFVSWMVQTVDELPTFKGFPQAKESVQASLFVQYYRPSGIGDEMGTWSIYSLPEVYKKQVFGVARKAGLERLESVWNTYIGMHNLLEGGTEKWEPERLPELEFEREVDLFRVRPTRERYVEMVNRLRALVDHPQFAGMYETMEGLLPLLQGAGGAAPAVPAAGNEPPVQ